MEEVVVVHPDHVAGLEHWVEGLCEATVDLLIRPVGAVLDYGPIGEAVEERPHCAVSEPGVEQAHVVFREVDGCEVYLPDP